MILTTKGVGVGLAERSRSSVDSNSNDAELRSFALSFEAVFEFSFSVQNTIHEWDEIN